MKTPKFLGAAQFRRSAFAASSAIAITLVSTAVSHGQVTIGFDSGLEIASLRVGQPEGSAVEWSDEFGGSVKITAPKGYNPVANFNLNNSPSLRAELDLALLYGGTLSYTVQVKPDALADGNPGWFETLIIGNSDGVWDAHAGPAAGQIGVTFPLEETTEYTVTMPLNVGGGDPMILGFAAASGWYELFTGINSGPEEGPHTLGTIYVTELTITANEAPPPSEESYVMDFESDTHGFASASDQVTVEWSELFGGSMKMTFDSTSQGWFDNTVRLAVNTIPELRTALDSALVGGGTLQFTAHVRQEDVIGGDPQWFEGMLSGSSANGSDREFGANGGVFSASGWPLTEPARYIVTMPVQPATPEELSGEAGMGNSILQFVPNEGSYNLGMGLNLQSNAGGDDATPNSASVYISQLILDPTPPPIPPVVGAYTFDTDLQGFAAWQPEDNEALRATVVHSSKLGGSMSVTIPAGEPTWRWWMNKTIAGDAAAAQLRKSSLNGGTFSIDMTGPVGTLAGRGMMLNVSASEFNQSEVSIRPEDVVVLGNGLETARVTWRVSGQVKWGNNPSPTVSERSSYTVSFGFYSEGYNGKELLFDNLTVAAYPEERAGLDFETDIANLVAAGEGGYVGQDSDGTHGRALIITQPGETWGARAVFSADSPDPNVQAVFAKLQEAATKGGIIRYQMTNPELNGRTEEFNGVTFRLGVEGSVLQQAAPINVPIGAFDSDETPPEPMETTRVTTDLPYFTRVIEVNVVPEGSGRTDGFTLDPDATSYSLLIGTNVAGVDELNYYIDDLQVIPNSTPEFASLPSFPQGGAAPMVGRVLGYGEQFATFSATGLPPGVTINSETGLISGTPTVNGTYSVVVKLGGPSGEVVTEAAEWIVTEASGAVTPLKITSISHAAGSVTLAWTGAGDAPVKVLRSTSLEPNEWTEVGTGIVTGTFTDSELPAGGKAFYQVVP